jgi:hypothetical protein
MLTGDDAGGLGGGSESDGKVATPCGWQAERTIEAIIAETVEYRIRIQVPKPLLSATYQHGHERKLSASGKKLTLHKANLGECSAFIFHRM